MKNNRTIVIFLVLFIFVFIYFYSVIDTDVLKEFDGGIFTNGTDVEEQVKVYINAKVDKRIFGNNVLAGTIRVGDNILYDFMIEKTNGYYQGPAFFVENNEVTEVGQVAASSGLDMFWAEFEELDEEYNTDTFVVAPAKDKEEGLQVIKDIFGE